MENLEERSQYYNCTNLTISQLNHMNLSRGLAAAVCVIILLLMLLFLCIGKAYTSPIQRLFLYLILATIFRELCLTATLEHQFSYQHQDQVCSALGFVTHWSSTIVILSALGVIIYTMILIWLSIKIYQPTLSKCTRVALEVAYLFIIIVLPLTVIWVPFINGNYGLAVAWCWIRSMHPNCKEVDLKEQLMLGYGGYEIVSVAGVLATLGLTITYCRVSNFPHVKKLLRQSLCLMLFVLLYLFFTNTGLAIRIYSGVTGWTYHYGMYLYHGMIIPLCQLIIPVGFLGSFYFGYFYRICCKKCTRRGQYEEIGKADPVPVHPSIPSSTFFIVPYTDGFTAINETSEPLA